MELEGRMKEPPKQLSQSAGRRSCCIFRVPQSLAEINEKAYQPHTTSIGPYHHGNPKFNMIEEHKWRFLDDLLRFNGTHPLELFKTVSRMEESIRESYSEYLNYDSYELVEMMVVDGCFIIALFCEVEGVIPPRQDDPLFKMTWVLPFLMRDLLLLENQIPYSVLEALYELCIGKLSTNTNNPNSRNSSSSSNNQNDGNCNHPSLARLALSFFDKMALRRPDVLKKYYDHKQGVKHLLDLFRDTYLPPTQEVTSRNCKSEYQQLIQCSRKLHLAGVKFKLRRSESSDSFLDIKFKNGGLEIPKFTIDDLSSSLFLNFVAYEQCYSNCTKHMTSYATFMGCLISNPSDAGFLCDRKIVENYFGTDDEVARFFNKVGKDVVFDIDQSYLSEVFEDVNEYCQNDWKVGWAEFKHTYFGTRWSFISALAAVVLLVLTMIQSFFAAYAYFWPPK
ncbi:UPF0481 protein At3g47200-like isoform X2 [Punica granatum]|uniref:UPF0481 protein At3g47200-like isoform X1 n=1 Tax=Punica granatum TaxID=22663 RepID=A0A6P8CY15_PUNGR|nr:UPF0481 protein At3g47200-like isoform X1 [Punica granatum]XP_031386939.1 UPF0481 protein At3g47200-like isoform X2 [Punica granatum]